MWHLIRQVVKKTPATARHHTPVDYAKQLVDAWSGQSTAASLPIHIQDALACFTAVHRLCLMSPLLQDDADDAEEITEEELRRALSLGVELLLLVMMVLHMLCCACLNKFLATLYFECTIFVFVKVLYHEPGPAAQ
ncbi:hypothetical protein Pcinc_016578 [Petrolisthes cinctipes]|uniref:Uncharacterized protein n=1 Tax=Petrolisthes cinctipes TaxID=88211 RepID=A0AAE1KPK3_PETCI|nr:hypothetical protein Pcinc_016578 [Petrolisthes cinctipes]